MTARREVAGGIVGTPGGELAVIFDTADATVLASGFTPMSDLATRLSGRPVWRGDAEPLPAALREAFQAYGDGQLDALDGLAAEQPGSEFRQRVWRTLRAQKRIVSYGTLAELAGAPRAARAVGTACATNLLGLIVPCHRVVRADGSLGQYGYGAVVKRRLLDHEARYQSAA
jgi:methylated-DNA-[protein]-cysteine S-methyltransferase